jgi:DNA-binding transcriptional ArsR family regulator
MTLPRLDIRPQPMVEDGKKLNREKLAVIASPIRLGIDTILSIRPATVAEIASELEVPAEKVRYHLNRMRDAGLVKLHGTTRRRGLAENLYIAEPRGAIISIDDARVTPSHHLDYPYTRALRLMFREVTEAVEADTFGYRPKSANVRFPLPLDEQGWDEVFEILDELFHGVLSVREASLDRVAKSGESPIRASAFILHFERVEADRR